MFIIMITRNDYFVNIVVLVRYPRREAKIRVIEI